MKYSSQRSKENRARIQVFLVCATVLLLQGCADFVAVDAGSTSSALAQPTLAIKTGGASVTVNQVSGFSATGITLSSLAVYSWKHTLSDVATGATIGPCIELSSASGAAYSIRCAQPGLLTISLSVFDNGKTLGPILSLQTIAAVVTSPPPPAPTPSGPNAAGSALYSTSCASCHGSLSNGNISSRSASGITSAISNVGQMRSISLTPSQIQSISDALNGK